MKKLIVFISVLIISMIVCISAERPRWVSLPITVYIPEYGNMSGLMEDAFLDWQIKSNNLVRFKFVSKPSNADIEVEFVDFVTNCNDIHSVGCTHMATRAGQYYKAYVTIGTKEYQYTRSDGQYVRKIVTRTKDHIYGVMLHEAGHAIGLGHSGNNGSIMYPYDLDSMQYLTDDDMNLLYRKYH